MRSTPFKMNLSAACAALTQINVPTNRMIKYVTAIKVDSEGEGEGSSCFEPTEAVGNGMHLSKASLSKYVVQCFYPSSIRLGTLRGGRTLQVAWR